MEEVSFGISCNDWLSTPSPEQQKKQIKLNFTGIDSNFISELIVIFLACWYGLSTITTLRMYLFLRLCFIIVNDPVKDKCYLGL